MEKSNNYYDEILTEIANLLKEGNYEAVYWKARNELEMPYIPQQVETKLVEFFKQANAVMNKQTNRKLQANLSLAEIENILLNSLDEEIHLVAFHYLKNYNARQILPTIRKYLMNSLYHNALKIHLLYVLKEQNIDEDFKVTKTNGTFTLNPIKIQDFYTHHQVKKIQKLLDQHVYNDNPSLFNVCLYILQNYYYALYPSFIDNNEVADLTCAIIYKGHLLQFDDVQIKTIAEQLNCSVAIANKYLELFEIEQVL